ncbi:MAG: hypothetical protein IPK72_21115 [Candidatus Eisenbacteria bacterium]|nr:hypothetical protein [Candidatus Eisenbacteria bacterium]
MSSFLKGTQAEAQSAARGMSEAYRGSLEAVRNYTAVAFAGVSAASVFALRAAQQAETSVGRARSAVTLAGESWDVYGGRVTKAAANLQALTKFGEEELLDTFARTVSLTGDVGASFDAMGKSADLAAALQIDLGAAGDLYAKALAGNVEMLGRFIPALRGKLAALGDTATAAEKTRLAMSELAKFTGAAAAQAQDSAGKWNNLGDQLGEVQEGIGAALIPATNRLAESLLPVVTALAEWTAKNPELTAGIVTATVVLTGLTAAVAALGLALPAVSAGLASIGVSVAMIPGFGWAIAGAVAIAGLAAASLTGAENAERHTTALEKTADITAKISKTPPVITISIKGPNGQDPRNYTDEEWAAMNEAAAQKRKEAHERELADVRSLASDKATLFIRNLEFSASLESEARRAAHEADLADYRALTGRKGELFIQGLEMEKQKKQEQRDADLAMQEAERKVWTGHLAGLGAAYDTFTSSLVNIEMTGKQRREAIIRSFASTVLQQASAVVKDALAKDIILGQSKATLAATGAAADATATASSVANSELRAAAESKSLAAKVYAFYASLGPFGIPLAAATLGLIFAGISGFVSKFAAGGSVPGAGYRDSVPALLTPGEFVVRREAAQNNLPLLQAINSGRGGVVAGSGGGGAIHIHLDRDAGLADVLRLRRLFEEWLPPALESARERGAFTPGAGIGGAF